MASKLEQLRQMTVVVADTGNIEAVRRLEPQDCTTNPTLLLKAVENPAYAHLVEEAVAWGRSKAGSPDAVAAAVCDRLAVSFGTELIKLVPGRVSTEVDADLSFDTRATVDKARAAYEARGVGRDRILIKIASTFEGIRAAETLQRERIDCNLTLLFSLPQAAACADAAVFLISPFCGPMRHSTGLPAFGPVGRMVGRERRFTPGQIARGSNKAAYSLTSNSEK
jgi:transaldolase